LQPVKRKGGKGKRGKGANCNKNFHGRRKGGTLRLRAAWKRQRIPVTSFGKKRGGEKKREWTNLHFTSPYNEGKKKGGFFLDQQGGILPPPFRGEGGVRGGRVVISTRKKGKGKATNFAHARQRENDISFSTKKKREDGGEEVLLLCPAGAKAPGGGKGRKTCRESKKRQPTHPN